MAAATAVALTLSGGVLNPAETAVTETVEMVADLMPGSGGASVGNLTAVGNTLFFTANDGVHGAELWKSDGTAAGAALVKDINVGAGASTPSNLTAVGGTLFFTADDGSHGEELWKSDGTEAGTVLVKDTHPTVGGTPSWLTAVDGTVFFATYKGGHKLWKSDGTEAGTVPVKQIDASYPQRLTSVGGTLFFLASDSTHGQELWKSDGTDAGTVLVEDVNPGSATSDSVGLTAVGDTLFFAANDGVHGGQLWKSDGTESGTVMVKEITPGGTTMKGWTAMGGRLFFIAYDGIHGLELWSSDGTESGTVLVNDTYPGGYAGDLSWLTVARGSLFFAADEGLQGIELWKSDGTSAGTVLVKDINPGNPSGYPTVLTAVGDSLFFSANDGSRGEELWKSDGTSAGTVLMRDINPGTPDGNPQSLTAVGRTLFFVANDGVHGPELWKAADITPPDTMITSGPGAGSTVTSSSVTFGFAGTADDTARLQCTLDGSAFTDCVSPKTFTGLADGGHTVAFRAIDASGNVDASPASRSFTVDTTAPDTVITSGPAEGSTVTTHSVTFGFEGTAGDTAQLQCSLNGAAFADCVSPKTFTGLADGGYTVAFRAIDAAGNSDPSPASRSFTVDTTAPDTVITSGPAAGATVTTNSVTFGFAGTAEDTAKLQCRLDGAAFADCVSPKTFTGVADGEHTVAFRAIDVAGHMDPTPASRSFTVSAATVTPPPPVVPSNAFTLPKSGVAKLKKGTVTLSVALPGAGQVTLAGGKSVKTVTTSVTGAGTVKLTITPSKKGLKTLKAKLAAAKKKGQKAGSLKVKVKVTFTPTGGVANTQSRAYTLKLK